MGRKELKSKKENIKNLKENFSVQLDEDFDQYTSKELCAELKLRNMNSLNAKKSILIQRLNGEIDAPPKKKAENQKDQIKCMFACILRRRTKTMQIRRFWEYSVPKKKANQKATEQLIEDIEKKYGDKKKKIEAAKKEIDKKEDDEERMKAASDALVKAFGGKDDEAPFCDVNETILE